MLRALSFLTGALALSASAQLPGGADPAPADPVTWSISMVQVEGTQWDLIFRADIIDGWYVYSPQSLGDAGPMPTTLVFDTLPHVTLTGNAAETGAHVVQGHDAVFDMRVKKFKGYALFTQRVTLSDPGSPITGRLEYMSCGR